MYRSNNGGFTVPYPSTGRSQTQGSSQTSSMMRSSSQNRSLSSANSQPKSMMQSASPRNVPQPVASLAARPRISPVNAGAQNSSSVSRKDVGGLNMSRPPLPVVAQSAASAQGAQGSRISEVSSMFAASEMAERQGGYIRGRQPAMTTPLGGAAVRREERKSLFSVPAVKSISKAGAREQEESKSRYASSASSSAPKISERKSTIDNTRSRLSEAKVSSTAFSSSASVSEFKREEPQQEDVVMMNSSNVAMRNMDDMQNAYGEGSPRRVMDVSSSPASGYNSSRRAKAAGNNKLVVGSQIKLSGEISSCEELIVDGEVEANLTDTGTIEVSENGHFKGSAEVNVADISGVFEGNLTASENLFVRSTGRVIGNIKYTTIVVEPGGVIDGVVEIAKSA